MGVRKRGAQCCTQFIIQAEPVLSQSDLRYSVSLSLVGKTERFLKVKMTVKGDG